MKTRIVVTAASLGVIVLSASLMALNAHGAVTPAPVSAPSSSGPACASYCTAGVSTNGCQAAMSCAGTPSAAATSGFVLTTSGIEGQKNALMRFSISGQIAVPWAASGSSFLCIKAPHQKMGPVQNSGGTSGACDGSIQVDFLAWTSTHLWPIAMGDQFFVQTFYKDPPAPKSISLSDAIEFTIVP